MAPVQSATSPAAQASNGVQTPRPADAATPTAQQQETPVPGETALPAGSATPSGLTNAAVGGGPAAMVGLRQTPAAQAEERVKLRADQYASLVDAFAFRMEIVVDDQVPIEVKDGIIQGGIEYVPSQHRYGTYKVHPKVLEDGGALIKDGYFVSDPLLMARNDTFGYKLALVEHSGDPAAQRDLARLLEDGRTYLTCTNYWPKYRDYKLMVPKFQGGHGAAAMKTADGQGVMTLNNPPNYLSGSFAGSSYKSFHLQGVEFPACDTAAEQEARQRNLTTWTAIASLIPFTQTDFDGSDRLGVFGPEQVREAAENLIGYLVGDAAAESWMADNDNATYCAEMVHVGLNCSVFPLNKPWLDEIEAKMMAQGRDAYQGLFAKIKAVVEGDEGALTRFGLASLRSWISGSSSFGNPNADRLPLTMAPDSLVPLWDKLGEEKLAIRPYTFGDLVRIFIHFSFPRPQESWTIAKLQEAALLSQQADFVELTGVDKDPAQRATFDKFMAELRAVIGRKHADRAAFDAALEKIFSSPEYQLFTSHDHGIGLFMPPSIYMTAIEGREGNAGGWAVVKPAAIAMTEDHVESI